MLLSMRAPVVESTHRGMAILGRGEEGSAMKTEAEIRDLLLQAWKDVHEELASYDPYSVELAKALAVVATLRKVLGE